MIGTGNRDQSRSFRDRDGQIDRSRERNRYDNRGKNFDHRNTRDKETGSIVVIVEIPETGLTKVTVGIDFILETMIIETITGKTTTEAPVEIGILAEKDMIDPVTEKLVSTVMEPITLQSIATSSKELTTITKKSMNQIQISQKLHKGHKQTTLHAIMNIQQTRQEILLCR